MFIQGIVYASMLYMYMCVDTERENDRHRESQCECICECTYECVGGMNTSASLATCMQLSIVDINFCLSNQMCVCVHVYIQLCVHTC